MDVKKLNERVGAARAEVEARGESFYPGASRIHLAAFPPKERWDDWVELDSRAWPERSERRYMLVPTTCFNCESACGLLAYVDRDSLQVRKLEGNPEHPASRGRNCAKGPATHNQIVDPDRILHPLKRVGPRGSGKWEPVSWDEALDDVAGRITKAIDEERHNEVVYHVGRPGEDGYTERVLAAWGLDGHNSHTNICSSGGRAGYVWWMGYDRPSADFGNAQTIILVSAQLESGHYFNPHAQRILEAKAKGAKIAVLDVRLSNTATHADWWIAPYPGTEPVIFLAIARELIASGRYNREFVRQWWNWEEFLEAVHPDAPRDFDTFEATLLETYGQYTFEYAQAESGADPRVLAELTDAIARGETRLATQNWRSAAAGNLGGWQVSRTLFMLNALMGAVAVEGGTYPNSLNKFVARPMYTPPHPKVWNDLSWPQEYPLAMNEMSFLLPHMVNEGRGKLDVYFTRVYNPLWTNPDGFSWIEMLRDEEKLGLHVALTPTWNESAYFADYVLPMGLASERHDIHSYETHDGQWIGFRQPVLRAARERLGEKITDTREANPGEVWEENEFWIELSWRLDPTGERGIRQYFEPKDRPGEKLTVDDYYGWIFERSVPGLPEAAEAEGLSPLAYMRRYGAFEVETKIGPRYQEPVPEAELDDPADGAHGRVYTRAPKPAGANIVPLPAPDPDSEGRRPVGVRVDGELRRGFPTPSGRLEFYSSTLASWGWDDQAIPGYIKSHIHPENLEEGQVPLIPTFRIPIQIHTRSANSKWLDEIAHTNPVWIHPSHAAELKVRTGELLRVQTEIGYFVAKAWVTEGIRPGVVACSHHMGRWKLPGHEAQQRQLMNTVSLDEGAEGWKLSRLEGPSPGDSEDADLQRMWWTDAGVHQNLTFPVHPDPISGMHCWHQGVWVKPAEPGDEYGDVFVDTRRSRAAYQDWLKKTRPASEISPNGERRPYWLLRPLKPDRPYYQLPDELKKG